VDDSVQIDVVAAGTLTSRWRRAASTHSENARAFNRKARKGRAKHAKI